MDSCTMRRSVSFAACDVSGWGRAAITVDQAHEALGHRTFEAEGAVFVRNPALPDIHVANYCRSVTVATREAMDRLLARADREFRDCPHRCFEVDPDTPTAFEDRLMREGYEAREFVLMVLEGELPGRPKPVELELAASEASWAAADRLKRIDWAEAREKAGLSPLPRVGDRLALASRLKTPPDRKWLVLADGAARGMSSAWQVDGLGQVEDVFVEPAYRHRGIATALIHHCVADCRAQGAGAVVIVADAADTPRHMYAAMGFRAVATKRRYVRYPRTHS
jgi:ribosomal protein S18 acetylase RimI-like enzyme